MKAKKKSNYDMSTDYQLPPGDVWWSLDFRVRGESQHSSILFCDMNKAATYFQANQQVPRLLFEFFNGGVIDVPSFKLTLLEL